jgi:hypothetical protein
MSRCNFYGRYWNGCPVFDFQEKLSFTPLESNSVLTVSDPLNLLSFRRQFFSPGKLFEKLS